MKSLLIWLLSTLIGAAIGYGISWLTGINLYLCTGVGIIIGNSAGVTANIHRGKETIAFDSDLNIKSKDSDLVPTENEIKS
jgi:hypothetical protein